MKKLFLKRLAWGLLAVSPSNLPKRSFVLILTVLLFLGTFIPSHFADAFFHGRVGEVLDIVAAILFLMTPFGWATIGVQLILMFVGVLAFIPVVISAFVLNVVLSDLIIFVPYTSGGVVDVGWLITRDIANLLFIVILLVIAVATMLGQENRGIRLLPKLIAIALLVNFTKVIAGLIVDFANIITSFFLKPVTNYGNIIVNLFIQESFIGKLIRSSTQFLQDLTADPATWLNVLTLIQANFSISAMLSNVISTIMMVIVAFLISFTLLVFAAIFLVRYIAIWILVIFSPLAFAAMILPDTAKFAKQWWSSFIKWSFIGVGPAFMLYLSAKMIGLKKEIMGDFGAGYTYGQDVVTQNGGFLQILLLPIYSILADLFFWIVILVFLWIGLMTTISMNKKVTGWATKATGKALKGMGKLALARIKEGGTSGAAGRIAKVGARVPGVEKMGKLRARAGAMLPAKDLRARAGGRVGQAMGAAGRVGGFLTKPIGIAREKWDNLSIENREAIKRALAGKKPTKGDYDDETDEKAQSMFDSLTTSGTPSEEVDAAVETYREARAQGKPAGGRQGGRRQPPQRPPGEVPPETPGGLTPPPPVREREGVEEADRAREAERTKEAAARVREGREPPPDDEGTGGTPTPRPTPPRPPPTSGAGRAAQPTKTAVETVRDTEEQIKQAYENLKDTSLSREETNKLMSDIDTLEAEQVENRQKQYEDLTSSPSDQFADIVSERPASEQSTGTTQPRTRPQKRRAAKAAAKTQLSPQDQQRIDRLIRDPAARESFRGQQKAVSNTPQEKHLKDLEAAVIEQIGEQAWLGQQATRGAEVPPETPRGGAGTFLERL